MTTLNVGIKICVGFFALSVATSSAFADEFDWSSSVPSDSLDTRIETLALPQVTGDSAPPNLASQWSLYRAAFQKALGAAIAKQTSIQVATVKKSASFRLKKPNLKKLCTAAGADAALIGEYRGPALEFQIIAGYDGRVLGSFSVPAPIVNNVDDLAKNTVAQFRARIRYQGYIKSTHAQATAQITMGSKDGITVGTLIEAFDFVGKRPSFDSPQKSYGILQVTNVTPTSSTVKIVTATTRIRPALKLRLMHVASAASLPPQPEPAAPIPPPVAAPQTQARVASTPLPTITPDTTAADIEAEVIPKPDLAPAPLPRARTAATPYSQTATSPIAATTPRPVARATPQPAPSNLSYNNNRAHQPRLISDRFWLALGPSMFGISTQISSQSLAARQFQVSPAAAVSLGLGYSRLNLWGQVGFLSNSNNSVTFTQIQGDFQFYTSSSRNIDYLSFIGVYDSQYSVTPAQNSTQILTTSSVLAPFLEERFVWKLQNRNSWALAPRIYYPISSNDAIDGSGNSGSSYGAGLEVDFQRHLSDKFGLDIGANAHYFSLSLPQSQTVGETFYTLFLRAYLY